ncbi:AbrB/MazE/SpoVT family DNA-binding domain-containing protein [Bradyrhizobium liaoningense]|uniref:AbrB/MazE/SpoVT family DNA-binding domain-containing protein n=1 Tax=Bradyrhizobium liaoningense TaxID=43992 RepID=UPI001BA844F2|nr:AbrB/MazE/SpoVT family DNA-binding domain-containing protein [Bradyrhizobium liaoningense]MBR0988658.1 AbrB/MazE/SpoVT family DNA-binding domain-containing protein [Bradyrhizobium liaoningense]
MKVFKWDDDLAIELPKELVDQLALKEGDEIEVIAADESATLEGPKDRSGRNPPR